MVTLAAIVYVSDYLVFRIRAARGQNVFSDVTIEHYDAIREKNGKTEFIFHDPTTQRCVHALFPHAGQSPCWYVERHKEQRTDI
jgi:hypothetical protein